MKILYLTPFPLQNETCEDLSHIFSTQFGYYTLKSKGVDIYWHSHNRNSLIYRLCKKMKIPQLNQIFSQLSLIGYAKNYDVVYCGFDMHLLPLALLKMVGIVKTPIFVLSHFSYNTKYTSNKIKRIYKRIERKLVYKSIEKISFANEILLNVAKQDYNVPTKHWNVANWGANLKFYDRTKFMIPPQNQYFVAAGGMNRDYYTLVEAFKKIPLYLKIFAKYKAYKNEIPQNVSFENLQANYSSIEAYQKLRFHYYNSIAILLPIDYLNDVPMVRLF